MPQQRSFIDTNILIYAEARDLPLKQQAALALLRRLFTSASGVLSTHVLKEYCNVALKKLKLPPEHVRAQMDLYAQFEVVQVTPAIIRAGLELHQNRSLAFYDSLVLASAQAAGCAVLFSEDMNSGERVSGLQIVNPFR